MSRPSIERDKWRNKECLECLRPFFADNRKRKFCSASCSASVRNRLMRKEKPEMVERVSRQEWTLYWALYHQGHVTIDSMKNLMADRFTSI